jgi:hypothetical protein
MNAPTLLDQFMSASESAITARAERDVARPRNPKPPSSIIPGSATSAVLAYLKSEFPAWRRESQIMWALGINRLREDCGEVVLFDWNSHR